MLDHFLEVHSHKPGALPGAVALTQARASGRFTAAHERFWKRARRKLGDRAGTRALIEVLLLHRRLPFIPVHAALDAVERIGSVDPALVAIEARRIADGRRTAAVVERPAFRRFDRPASSLATVRREHAMRAQVTEQAAALAVEATSRAAASAAPPRRASPGSSTWRTSTWRRRRRSTRRCSSRSSAASGWSGASPWCCSATAAPDPWAWPGWSQASLDGTFGNRWDDPEGAYRVLYASSTRFGALLDTLARFRPDLAVIAGLSEIEGRDNPISSGDGSPGVVRQPGILDTSVSVEVSGVSDPFQIFVITASGARRVSTSQVNALVETMDEWRKQELTVLPAEARPSD